MKVLIVGVNGKVGTLIYKNAIKRNLDVTGLGRGDNKNNIKQYIKKDCLDLTKNDIRDFDVIVDAVGGWTEQTIPNITSSMIHLADIISNTDKRLIVVGGAGSLYVNEDRTITVDMGKDFPESWKPLSNAHGKGLNYLRNTKDLNWTYISPACDFSFEGKQEGTYTLGGEDLILNSKGLSYISYSDYAIALVDEIIANKHNKERISVVSK